MSVYSEAQKQAIYRWRANNKDLYHSLQKIYKRKYVMMKKIWRELSHLAELYD